MSDLDTCLYARGCFWRGFHGLCICIVYNCVWYGIKLTGCVICRLEGWVQLGQGER